MCRQTADGPTPNTRIYNFSLPKTLALVKKRVKWLIQFVVQRVFVWKLANFWKMRFK